MQSPEAVSNEPTKMSLSAEELEGILVRFMSQEELNIPPLPQVVLQLQEVVAKDDFSADELAAVVQTDQVLCATVLKYANRTAFMRNSAIISLNSAIARIGAHELVTIAFGATLGATAAKPGPLLNARTAIWQQAVVSALLCQNLSRPFDVFREVAFLTGFLHDFGKVLGITALEEELKSWDKIPEAPLSFWLEVIEPFHIELGIIAAAKWNLPEPLPEVIAAHHSPAPPTALKKEINLIQASDQLGALLEQSQKISGEELDRIDALYPELSRADLERVLTSLPGAVSSLTGHGWGLNRTAKNAVLRDGLAYDASIDHKLEFSVTIEKEGREFPTTPSQLSFDGLSLQTRIPMPENFIAQLTVTQEKFVFSFFANLISCVPESQGYTCHFRPFCLSAENEEQWLALVRKSKEH